VRQLLTAARSPNRCANSPSEYVERLSEAPPTSNMLLSFTKPLGLVPGNGGIEANSQLCCVSSIDADSLMVGNIFGGIQSFYRDQFL